MIISRTPLRVGFFGGGTDLKEFYRTGWTAVLSTAIKKYVYVTLNENFSDGIKIVSLETQIAKNVDQINDEIVKTCLRYTGVKNNIEIVISSDETMGGSGLGGSSSLIVGLLNCLHKLNGDKKSPAELAKEACEIEIDILKKPIGKQDQYIAAFGGLRTIRFNSDESVDVKQVNCSEDAKEQLQNNLIQFFTGVTRKSSSVLMEQQKNAPQRLEVMKKMREQVFKAKKALEENDVDTFGRMLDENWKLKKQLASTISNPFIDELYAKGIEAGALGGKVSGAGGGGFLLFYCPKEKQGNLKKELSDLKVSEVKFEEEGSRIIKSE